MLKEFLTKSPILRYYQQNKKIIIQVDASKYGLGATLFQGNQPVAMASKSLDNQLCCL